ncbi:unnamed protein product [Plutella xylostella]|uniref:(diamondback moth) hypothetical protein n=1 Tax=Plutella xylostella TaxID=51655 RepID=A0A8S4G3R1_PLUXY|nr:unnamed protein product [Plutella xylostella]
MILSAVKSFADELLRSALAGRLTGDRTSGDPPLPVWTSTDANAPCPIRWRHLLRALRAPRLHALGGRGRAAAPAAPTLI